MLLKNIRCFLRLANFNFIMKISTVSKGPLYSTDYRLFFRNENGFISPHHDIPLYANNEKTLYNMIIEIPRWSNAKFEIATKEYLNPIHQDTKGGQPRFVDNVFPYNGYIWNYGAFPQTWEDPNFIDPEIKHKGDNDPIDVLEIGYRVGNTGDVIQVKVLGAVCLIDQGETDWKVIVIDIRDPLSAKLNDIDDVRKLMPGYLEATIDWFTWYKVPAGKGKNTFAFNGEAKNREYALKKIHEVHEFWKKLIRQPGKEGEDELCCKNLTNTFEPSNLTSYEDAQIFVDSLAPFFKVSRHYEFPKVDTWHFVDKKQK